MIKTKFKILFLILLSFAVFISCEDRTELTAPAVPNTGSANFSKFVSLGNSLTAAYQSGALYKSSQEYSYGKMIANAVGANYEQPYISDPGIGGRIEIAAFTSTGISTFTNPADAGTPLNLGYQGIYNNLGIPGALLVDLLQATSKETSVSGNNIFFDLILRGQGTALEQAITSQPTLATLWIGNNDILGYATSGGLLPHTPVAIFDTLYKQLTGALAQAGVPVVVANIPDVKAIPFFTTVGPSVGLAIQKVQATNPNVLGLVYQLSVSPFIGLATVQNLLGNDVLLTLTGASAAAFIGDTQGLYYSTNNIPVPEGVNTAFPFGLTPENPFPSKFVLDPAEQIVVQEVTASFNLSIATAAIKYGFHLVDMNSFFNNVAANGFVSDGVQFKVNYVTGGLFSLDGVHPTSQGYGVVANEFIKTINLKFNAQIPLINVATIPGSIDLHKKVNFNEYGLPIFQPGTFDTIFY